MRLFQIHVFHVFIGSQIKVLHPAVGMLAGTIRIIRIGHQLFHHIQLMITRENYLYGSLRHLLFFAMLVNDNLQFLFFLTGDVPLKYGKQHFSAQDFLPQIRSDISSVLTFGIARTAYFSRTVGTLIKRDKESLFLF